VSTYNSVLSSTDIELHYVQIKYKYRVTLRTDKVPIFFSSVNEPLLCRRPNVIVNSSSIYQFLRLILGSDGLVDSSLVNAEYLAYRLQYNYADRQSTFTQL